MIFSGITPAQVEQIVAQVSVEHYAGNVVPEWVKYGRWGPTTLSATRFRGQIVVWDSYGRGARRSGTGRRMPAACWHVFRDVLGPMLLEHGARRISTSQASYTPENWEELYPCTAYRNVGSLVHPVELRNTCDCNARGSATAPHRRTLFPPSPIMESDENYQASLARIDEVLAGVVAVSVGSCATCGNPTGSADMVWCSHDCQAVYQAKQAGL